MLNLHRNSFQALIRTTQVLLISITVVLASGCSGGGSGHASAPPSGDGGAGGGGTGGGGTGGGGTGGGGTGGGGTGGGDTGGSQLTPDADAPPITAALGTALHHAQMCAQYLGPIPEMSCSDAQVVPITVDGVEVFETPRTCDKPSALTGTCETGERIAARYMGSYHNGLSRPEVVFVNFCRDGGMGVIGHNSETGATCFFHKRLDTFPNDVAHPGSDDPDSNYDQYWQPPAEVAADNCQECHQADPWIHSPWIDQLPDPAHPLQTLVPAIATKDSPYIVIGDDFSQPYHEGAPDNSCTSCHKPQCDDLFAVKLGELAMPGPFNNHDHVIGVTPDLQELRDWCGTIPRVNQIGGGNEE